MLGERKPKYIYSKYIRKSESFVGNGKKKFTEQVIKNNNNNYNYKQTKVPTGRG